MYDAVVVLSFGGPEGPDDVMPFLENVTRGRDVPPSRLAAVAAHYELFGGVSPINAATRALVAAVSPTLDIPVYWGNRNWHPFLADTVTQMLADGVRRAACFVTSAYAGYSSCRQYIEDIERAIGGRDIVIDKLRPYFDHPGFIGPMVENVASALSTLDPHSHLLFTAHSIPSAVAATNAYADQVAEASRLVAEAVGGSGVGGSHSWQVAWQSRSGPPSVPWLEPDVGDVVAGLDAPGVVIVPIGFVADHMEVVYDLDVVAMGRAVVPAVRAATVGTAPAFVAMVGQLVAERERNPVLACADGCCPGQTARRGP